MGKNVEPRVRSERDDGAVSIRWSWVGYGGIMVGIASLGTLVVVATVKQVDTLSTVALVLAVLAFVIQIIVFIAQTAAANEQAVSVQAVNAETRALLAEVRTNTQQTNDTLNQQFNTMLNSVVQSVKLNISEDTLGGDGASDDGRAIEAIRSDVLAEFQREVARAQAELSSVPGTNSNLASAYADTLRATLSSRRSRVLLAEIARNAANHKSFRGGIDVDPEGIKSEDLQALVRGGLIAVDDTVTPPQVHLTSEGRRLAPGALLLP